MSAKLSLNEIRNRALNFSKEWENETSEHAESQTFWNEFFQVFGLKRRKIAIFEQNVKIRKDGASKFIDLLWPGNLVVEQKSLGKSLDKAYKQAVNYCNGLNDHDFPQYIILSDFENFRIYDLDSEKVEDYIHFKLKDFYKNIHHLGFISGYEKIKYEESDPVNIKAAEEMAKFHDKLKDIGYDGHDLEVYLVRLLFCLFADDTGIFDKDLFLMFLMV